MLRRNTRKYKGILCRRKKKQGRLKKTGIKSNGKQYNRDINVYAECGGKDEIHEEIYIFTMYCFFTFFDDNGFCRSTRSQCKIYDSDGGIYGSDSGGE